MGQARIIVKKGIRQAACICANFKKNAELGMGGGLMDVETRLQMLQRPLPPPPPPQNDEETAASTSTNTTVATPSSVPSSSSSSSSSPEPMPPRASSVMQEKLLTSYPSLLRQTVENFLPAPENAASESMAGFPSHLIDTSLRLSNALPESRRSNIGSGKEADGSCCVSGGA